MSTGCVRARTCSSMRRGGGKYGVVVARDVKNSEHDVRATGGTRNEGSVKVQVVVNKLKHDMNGRLKIIQERLPPSQGA